MTDPAILFIKPKAISDDDKKALRDAGVIIVEISNPADAKFVRPHSELSGSEILRAAAMAISKSDAAKIAFGTALASLLAAPHQ